MTLRLVYAGTPEVAVPALERLVARGHDVALVLTRPDARVGRGRALQPSPVAAAAERLGLPVLRTARPNDPEVLQQVREVAPDLAPVVAYGGLIGRELLATPRLGWVNLHFSLLPAWRGAAPVQHAIGAGDEVTGASVFQLDEGLDTGPVLGTMVEELRGDDTAGAVLDRLAVSGAELLCQVVDGLGAGRLVAVPQPDDGVSHAPKLTDADAEVRWDQPAFAVDRLVRSVTPEPGAWTTWDGARLRVFPVSLPGTVEEGAEPLTPGRVRVERRRVLVGTATGPVVLGDVAPAGRKRMPATDWARGARPGPGAVLGGADRTGKPGPHAHGEATA